MVLLFYFVTLIAETLLALRLNGAEWNCKKTGMGSPWNSENGSTAGTGCLAQARRTGAHPSQGAW